MIKTWRELWGTLGTASVTMNIINRKEGWAHATTKLLDAKTIALRLATNVLWPEEYVRVHT
jgi:hypothetical protein